MHKICQADSLFPKERRNYIGEIRAFFRLGDVNQQEALNIKSAQKIGSDRTGQLNLAMLLQTRVLIMAFLPTAPYGPVK